jgi:hypothetical protein
MSAGGKEIPDVEEGRQTRSQRKYREAKGNDGGEA